MSVAENAGLDDSLEHSTVTLESTATSVHSSSTRSIYSCDKLTLLAKLSQKAPYYVPILKWLPVYTASEAMCDFQAGLRVTALIVPQGIAFAQVNSPIYPSLLPHAMIYDLLSFFALSCPLHSLLSSPSDVYVFSLCLTHSERAMLIFMPCTKSACGVAAGLWLVQRLCTGSSVSSHGGLSPSDIGSEPGLRAADGGSPSPRV